MVEGLVIVASILLAFAIEAGWSARNDGLRRDALLAAVDREMVLAGAEQERVTGHHTAGLEATAALLSLGSGDTANPSSARLVDSLLAMAYNNTATFDAPSGALEGLLRSGNLDLLDDGDLLTALTSHPRVVANLAREQAFLAEVGLRLMDYLGGAGVDLSRLNAAGIPGDYAVPWSSAPTVAYSIVDEPHFRSLINELFWRYRNSVNGMENLGGSISRIRSFGDQARSR